MRIRPLVVALLASTLALAACNGPDEAAATPVPTSTTTTTAPPTTTTTTAPAPVPRSSLTGQRLDPAVIGRPVVAVKIDNVDGRSTPQMGINEADVVYEIQVEGQVTRLLSLFQSSDVGPVGPVRSARGSEIGVLEELNAPLFAWHGANGILGPLVRQSQVVPRSIDDVPHLYFRMGGRRAPYNSFIHGTAQIRETAPEGSTGPADPIFDFAAPGEPPSPHAVPASFINIRFNPPFGGRGSGGSPVFYNWLGDKWNRSQNGHPHVDAAGRQVAVDNVIVRFHQPLDSGTRDSAGSLVPTAQVLGSGEAWVFSQGTVTVGTWHKPNNTSRTTYVDQDGKHIKLTPGKTWISMPYSKPGSSFG
jgi:hypothetical protein